MPHRYHSIAIIVALTASGLWGCCPSSMVSAEDMTEITVQAHCLTEHGTTTSSHQTVVVATVSTQTENLVGFVANQQIVTPVDIGSAVSALVTISAHDRMIGDTVLRQRRRAELMTVPPRAPSDLTVIG